MGKFCQNVSKTFSEVFFLLIVIYDFESLNVVKSTPVNSFSSCSTSAMNLIKFQEN